MGSRGKTPSRSVEPGPIVAPSASPVEPVARESLFSRGAFGTQAKTASSKVLEMDGQKEETECNSAFRSA